MKLRKVLLTVFSALLIVTLSVGATVAYLTSTDEVKNTFTVGNVGISLLETVVDEYGTPNASGATSDQGNEYKLLPGHTYTKDPAVVVSPLTENAWLFVKVENGIASIEAASTEEHPDIAKQMESNGWSLVTGTEDIYAYKEIAEAGDWRTVFEEFTVADNADITGYDNAEIKITAYAVQAAGFATAADAWAATFGKTAD